MPSTSKSARRDRPDCESVAQCLSCLIQAFALLAQKGRKLPTPGGATLHSTSPTRTSSRRWQPTDRLPLHKTGASPTAARHRARVILVKAESCAAPSIRTCRDNVSRTTNRQPFYLWKFWRQYSGQGPGRQNKSRAQSWRRSAKRQVIPSCNPKERPIRPKARFRMPSAVSKTQSETQ